LFVGGLMPYFRYVYVFAFSGVQQLLRYVFALFFLCLV
jgi:hypothetical protein